MKTICLNLNIHRPFRLKKYEFFDIGHNNFYFDELDTQTDSDQKNRDFVDPLFDALFEMIEKFGTRFNFSATVSGCVLDVLDKYYSESILDRYRKLYETGNVEFLGMPYNHSLTSIADMDSFKVQVKKHVSEMQRLIGATPTAFRNTELIYTDKIGLAAYDLGFSTVLAEGVGPGLDSRGPNFVYFNPLQPRQHVITRNVNISRILEDSLKETNLFTPEYFVSKLYDIDDEDVNVIYLGINFEQMDGTKSNREEVPKFLKSVIESIIETGEYEFLTMTEASHKYQPVAPYHVVEPVSGMTRKHDLSPWQGNELQKEALRKITALGSLIHTVKNDVLTDIWERLQCSDYFLFMSTDNLGYKVNHFKSPYDAFITYMNIIDD
ncbi:MAG: hypothetical protein K6F33_12085, partial [Bacteroidales bacterium]|nr:hypothetical protein [Bacteroidales bacterium]